MTRIPILMYHRVAPGRTALPKYSVTPTAFAAQMRWLAFMGYESIGFDVLHDYRGGQRKLPRRPVIITFDDGFEDSAVYAVPILQAQGYTAAFFLVVHRVGLMSDWLLRDRGTSYRLFDWDTARELQRAGFSCASHTLTHPRLSELSRDACSYELSESRRIMETELGHEVKDISYPFGSYNDTVRRCAATAGYRCACTVRGGVVSPDDDFLSLRRVPISGLDTLADFVFRVQTARSLTESVGSVLRKIRRPLRVGGV